MPESNERSAEFYRGALSVLEGRPCTAEYYRTLLAAAEAREKEALSTDWEDAGVQYIYNLLCATELPGGNEEHWEGKVARMAVAYMRGREATQPTAAEQALTLPELQIKHAELAVELFNAESRLERAAEVIEACRVALEDCRRNVANHPDGHHKQFLRSEEMAESALALCARWKEANGGH